MSPVPLAQFQMAPILSVLISSGSKKKEPRCVCLGEDKASHSHKMWTEVSSVPHFLQVRLLLSRIIYICLLKVTCSNGRALIEQRAVHFVIPKQSTAPVIQKQTSENLVRYSCWDSNFLYCCLTFFWMFGFLCALLTKCMAIFISLTSGNLVHCIT